MSEDFSDDGCLRDESDDTHRLAAKEQERIDLVDAANQPGPRFPAGRSFTGRVPPSAPYWTGSIGAVGKGRWPAVPAIAGMVAGAALSAEHYPFFKTTVLAWKVFGKIGLPEALGVSPWIIIPIFRAGTILQFCRFEKKGV